MIENTTPDVPATNQLLASLPAAEYNRLLPDLEKVTLDYGAAIYERGDPIRHVFFPLTGIISLLAGAEDGATLEVGVVGREGMVGLAPYLGVATSGNVAVVQGNGSAMRLRTVPFLAACHRNGKLPRLLRRFAQSLLAQVSQSAVCYRFHDADARLARWLLMTSDRMADPEFHLTQEFLAKMLGVRREAVNKSAGALQHEGLITYSRGNISILDRAALEDRACTCYAVIRTEEASFPVE